MRDGVVARLRHRPREQGVELDDATVYEAHARDGTAVAEDLSDSRFLKGDAPRPQPRCDVVIQRAAEARCEERGTWSLHCRTSSA